MVEEMNKWKNKNPWLGLESYDEGQHLYGRDQETEALTHIIINHPTTVVYGKSGIGKSSLLKAGIFPRLRENAMIPIYIRLTHNTEMPYVQQIINAINENVTISDLLPANFPHLGLWDFLHRHQFKDAENNDITPVIVLDQFEEVFTLTDTEHKNEISKLFTELTDVLNGVKPNIVIEAEANYLKSHIPQVKESSSTGFTIQAPSQKSLPNYNSTTSFRFVFSIRDDSLYLLERNSAKIPALKINRFNLNALDETNAFEVITKPAPGLFTEKEASDIIEGLAYHEFDDYRIVDPAILSLFLFSYYREQGNVSKDDIFERYYSENTQPKFIKNSSLSYIEDNLLTERGNRNQVPLIDIYAAGVAIDEIKHLLECKILKTEKRKGTDYIEFSHDRLCEQALKHRQERKARLQTRKMLKRLISITLGCLLILALLGSIAWLLINNNRNKKELLFKDISLTQSENEKEAIKKVNDSILKLNRSLNGQIEINVAQKNSIADLNKALNKEINTVQNQWDELRLAYDENNALIDQKNALIDSLEKENRIKNVQATIINNIESAQTKNETKQNISDVSAVYNLCIRIRESVEQNNYTQLEANNQILKTYNLQYFNSLKCLDQEMNSMNGHFFYNTKFIDNLLLGRPISMFNEKEMAISTPLLKTDWILFKNCCIKTNGSTYYSYMARGHQEIAFVTEVDGLITVRIHVTNNNGYDEYYDDTKDVNRGRPYRYFTFDIPNDKRCKVDIEVINKSIKDISFVIISN